MRSISITFASVGLERSRPAAPRHFAQALRPHRGLRLFGDVSNLQKSEYCAPPVGSHQSAALIEPAIDNRPVSCHAAKWCLTPEGG
jgi:hypothetical protein